MMANNERMEEEALFGSYPYALYFVQSPSTVVSHPNACNTNLSSSSSRGSNNSSSSFHLQLSNKLHLPQQKTTAVGGGGGGLVTKSDDIPLVDDEEEEEEEDEDENEFYSNYDDKKKMRRRRRRRNKGWIKYLSFSYSEDSGWWILLQLSWRFLVSFFIALLVFYVAVKPPPPNVSIKIAGIGEFRLGEGVDGSGVSTKILNCNCSIDLIIDNNSNLFPLHIHPPTLEILFSHLPFATSQQGGQGREVNAGNDVFRLNVGTRNKAMYGAGRSMQDLLESGKGLPLVIRVSLKSRFHVVWGIIQLPEFHHQAQCLVVLADKYDKKHRTQVYNSTCNPPPPP